MLQIKRLGVVIAGGALLGIIGTLVSHAACSSKDASPPVGSLTVSGCAMERTEHGEPFTGGGVNNMVTEQTYATLEGSYAYSRTDVRQSRWEYDPADVTFSETYLFIDRAFRLAPLDRRVRVQATGRQWHGRSPTQQLQWTYAYADANTTGPGGDGGVEVFVSQYRDEDEPCRQTIGVRFQLIGREGAAGEDDLECLVEVPMLPEAP